MKACINNLSKAKYAKNDKKKTAKYSAQVQRPISVACVLRI